MKKSTITIILVITAILGSIAVAAQGEPDRDSLSMGSSYENDLFYSLETGQVALIERDNWEIGFYTEAFSTSIITNGGSGVILYTYPNGDTADWNNIDTTGFFSWKQLYNSPEDWTNGAFNRNTLGHPDYGWGIYNSSTHHIAGDSLFIIDLPFSGLWQLWIIEKDPVANVYQFKYAKLDGSEMNEVTYNISETTDKNFAYYSISNNEKLDREPDKDRWDILFTKYIELVPDLEGNLSPYIVTGALNNLNIASNQFYPVGPDFLDWSSQPMDSIINKIGYDWKTFDFGSFTWTIQDSNYYFLQNYSGRIYKLWFVWWDGSTTGDFALDKQFIETVGYNEIKYSENRITAYPNPVSDMLTIKSTEVLSGDFHLSLFDFSGRIALKRIISADELRSGYNLEHINLSKGLYILSVHGKDFKANQRIIVR